MCQTVDRLAEGQEERKKRFFEKYLEVLEQLPGDFEIDSRSKVWNIISYFHCGCYEKANAMLREVELYRCHFMPMQMLEIMKMFGNHLEEDVRAKMTAYVMESLEGVKNERLHSTMYNDNFSNMATYVLVIAGEMFGKPELVELGKQRLAEACEVFMRSGAIMEYQSPTYTPIDTLAFAQLANHAGDAWVREQALKCEERMWLEIATHYHPGTAMLAGPHSRAYGADSIGHPGLISGLMWKVFGDEVFANPVRDCFPPHENQVVHISLEKLMLPNVAWIIGVTYHCPEHLRELALHKTYPYHVSYRTECLPANLLAGSDTEGVGPGEYCHCSCGQGYSETYMTEDYALGTAENHFHSGAISNSFYLQFRLRPEADRLQDTAVMYSRYLFNDHLPDQTNQYAVYGEAMKSSFRDEGLKYGSQKDNISVMLYRPTGIEREHVKSARMTLLLPCYFYQDYEIWAGGERVKDFSYASNRLENIYLHAGTIYIAIKPLAATDLGRDIATGIELRNHHLMISYYNYHGAARSFEARELLLAQAGFICICASDRDYEDMESFRRYAEEGELTEDRMEVQERACCRRLRYRHGDTEFRMILNPEGGNFVADTVNGRPRNLKIFQADGITEREIPFLNED